MIEHSNNKLKYALICREKMKIIVIPKEEIIKFYHGNLKNYMQAYLVWTINLFLHDSDR